MGHLLQQYGAEALIVQIIVSIKPFMYVNQQCHTIYPPETWLGIVWIKCCEWEAKITHSILR